jgi:glycyl-tRNA synthetase
MTEQEKNGTTMEKIASLCKRRGFVFPSSEIYGGFAAVYDFGPYGVELANALKREWWKYMVQMREDIVGLDSAIFMHPKIWEASGHVSGFSDPLAECRNCHTRVRVDHLLEEVDVVADEKMSGRQSMRSSMRTGRRSSVQVREKVFPKLRNLTCLCNRTSAISPVMGRSCLLRGETCQGIYVITKMC